MRYDERKTDSDFITPAEALLGLPIEVLQGEEEARLIYTGVAQTLSDNQTAHLVIDVGGGSTEFILGCNAKPLRLESLPLGCVSYGEAFFSGGRHHRGSLRCRRPSNR